jgi:DNA gyrase subunit A
MAVKDLRVMGRATQGVKLINIKEGDSIAAVAKVMHEQEDENPEFLEDSENNSSSEVITDDVKNDASSEEINEVVESETSSEEINDAPLNNEVTFEITNEIEEEEEEETEE